MAKPKQIKVWTVQTPFKKWKENGCLLRMNRARITSQSMSSSFMINQTRPVVNRAANAFRMAAQTAGKSNSALGAFYRRLRSRLGSPKAITATAHLYCAAFLQTLDNRRRLYRSWHGLL